MENEPIQLARTFARLAGELVQKPSVEETLEGITASAAREIAGTDFAGVSLLHKGGRFTTEAATAPLVREIDDIQYATRQGPCVDAIWERGIFAIDDMAHEQRWPEFVGKVRGLGVESMVSFQLATPRGTLGGLNLYAKKAGAFDTQSRDMGDVLADHAAIALFSARKVWDLQQGMHTRQRIGEATGILMERFKVDDRQAFMLLSKASQDLNTKLRDLAQELVYTGVLPDSGIPPRADGQA
ncbi:GAF and ANTAR domain-containing protein [Streptomonospora litoralis]|uniref:ANTAR domain protein n=1 Tax=Streptomonospora litoralis TaxID=2498135 RepID=A0A4P6QB50_9ACTN|nr:GAF and ANTAR domain-containing protein [Streptomonospora litoralis]QBI56597.1 ANTAR domain protein [Streptomonospora litoralis]